MIYTIYAIVTTGSNGIVVWAEMGFVHSNAVFMIADVLDV